MAGTKQVFAQTRHLVYSNMAGDQVGTVSLHTFDSLRVQPNIYILDTRSKEEFNISHIPGATWVGYDSFTIDKVDQITKDSRVVLYCSVGYRSGKIGEQMQEAGYENVSNLYGGIFEWVNREYPIVNPEGEPTMKIHPYDPLWGKLLIKGEKTYE